MAKQGKPRAGSLQFWPRKKARKFLPSVNWKILKSENKGLLGFIAYKVGMISSYVKDLTADSMTKNKKIFVPSTILELPAMKIFSVRFYKNGKVAKEAIAESLDKELKRKLKIPKEKKKLDELIEKFKDFDDIRVIVYSKVKETGIKKTPDLCEIAIAGNLDEKINFVKEKINREIYASEVLKDFSVVDIRGLTKGKGLEGPVKRFGIKLKQHKTEKGRRRPGTLGPWHPPRVTYQVAMAGQLGMFSRIQYNSKIISLGKISENLGNINPSSGWKHFGNIKTEYVILDGSVPGAIKRQLLLTFPLRITKKQEKKKYEFLGVAK